MRCSAMKLLKITTAYPGYLKRFYDRRPELASMSHGEQKAALDFDAFGWSDFWSHALEPLGYEVMELTVNAVPLQRAWGEENGLSVEAAADLKNIAIEQTRRFEPDVLWYDDTDEDLLILIRSSVPSIRLVLGWVGSAIPKTDVWRHMDLVLSCAPESVAYMEEAGITAAHMNHGFDPRVNGRLSNGPKKIDCSFIGQMVRSGRIHQMREQLIKIITERNGIEIFSPSGDFSRLDDAKAMLKATVFHAAHALKAAGIGESTVAGLPVLGRALQWPAKPVRPVSRRLRKYLRPAVFGLEMFQVIRDSKVTLNVHADSSPRFASNMRLFETTGVGTCLVTDWKENLQELFIPDEEVVTYRSAEECIEKIRWLLAHPKEREAIAAAGMARTLREHTFSHRAVELDRILRNMTPKGRDRV